jgi:hypothetical protein
MIDCDSSTAPVLNGGRFFWTLVSNHVPEMMNARLPATVLENSDGVLCCQRMRGRQGSSFLTPYLDHRQESPPTVRARKGSNSRQRIVETQPRVCPEQCDAAWDS